MSEFCSEDFVEDERVRVYLNHSCSDLQVREGVVLGTRETRGNFGEDGLALQLLVEKAGKVNSGRLDMSAGPYRSSSRRIVDDSGEFVGNLGSYKQKFFYSSIVRVDRVVV